MVDNARYYRQNTKPRKRVLTQTIVVCSQETFCNLVTQYVSKVYNYVK